MSECRTLYAGCMSQINILFYAEAKDMRHQGTGEQEEQKVRVDHRVQDRSRSNSVTEAASRGTCAGYMRIKKLVTVWIRSLCQTRLFNVKCLVIMRVGH